MIEISRFSLKSCRKDDSYKDECVLHRSNTSKNFTVLLGDSHAASISTISSIVFKEHDLGLILSWVGLCPPILKLNTPHFRNCVKHNENAFEYISNDENIDSVVLFARWTMAFENTTFDNKEGGIEIHSTPDLLLESMPTVSIPFKKKAELFKLSMAQLITTGKKLYLYIHFPKQVGMYLIGLINIIYLTLKLI